MTRPGRTPWLAIVVAGLLAVLTGREVLKGIRGRHTTADAPTRHLIEERPQRGLQRSGDGESLSERVSQPLPDEVQLPRPSVWPMVLGGGLSLLLFGIVTSYAFIAIGMLLILGALGGWIGDLLYAGAD